MLIERAGYAINVETAAEHRIRMSWLESSCGVPHRFTHNSPVKFSELDRVHNAAAIDACWRYAAEWWFDWTDDRLEPCAFCGGRKYPSGSGLLLVGSVGTGKTLLATVTARRLLDIVSETASGDGVAPYVWQSVPAFCSSVRDSWSRKSDVGDLVRRLTTAALVVLDDLGGEVAAEWSAREIFNVLDARHADELPTLITSNLTTPKQFTKRYGERISSRLFSMCSVLELKGPDMRLAQANSKE